MANKVLVELKDGAVKRFSKPTANLIISKKLGKVKGKEEKKVAQRETKEEKKVTARKTK